MQCSIINEQDLNGENQQIDMESGTFIHLNASSVHTAVRICSQLNGFHWSTVGSV